MFTVKAEDLWPAELQPAAQLLWLTGWLDGSAKNTAALTLPVAVIQHSFFSVSTETWFYSISSSHSVWARYQPRHQSIRSRKMPLNSGLNMTATDAESCTLVWCLFFMWITEDTDQTPAGDLLQAHTNCWLYYSWTRSHHSVLHVFCKVMHISVHVAKRPLSYESHTEQRRVFKTGWWWRQSAQHEKNVLQCLVCSLRPL